MSFSQDTYRHFWAASDEDWSDWDATSYDGLDDSGISAKIRKYTGIADEKLSNEQIMNITRE